MVKLEEVKRMNLKMSSNLFHVYQPDTYGLFSGDIYAMEERENEYRSEYEERYRREEGQAALFPKDDPFWTNALITEPIGCWRPDALYVPNPEYKPGMWYLDRGKFLDVVARRWVEVFTDRMEEQGVPGKVLYTGCSSPREYNFSTDWANMTLSVSRRAMDGVFRRCLEDYEAFSKYLKEYHSSYDGFWSFCTNRIEEWKCNTKARPPDIDYERAVWQALGYVLWPAGADREEWNRNYCEMVGDLDGNGSFNDCWYFEAGNSEAV
jgi:hypothetical protein